MEFFTETEKMVYNCILPEVESFNLGYEKILKLAKDYHIVFIFYIALGLEQDKALELIKLSVSGNSSKLELDKKEMEYAGSKAFDLIKSVNQDPEYISGILKNFISSYCKIRSDKNYGNDEAFKVSILDAMKINLNPKTSPTEINQ